MKKLSLWAKKHPGASRVIIAVSHLLVMLNAVAMGVMLFLTDWETSRSLIVVLSNLFFTAYLFYPKRRKGRKRSYIRQKAHDFSLVLLYSLVLALGVHSLFVQAGSNPNASRQASAEFVVLQPIHEKPGVIPDKQKPTLKQRFRVLKRQFRRDFRALKKALKRKGDEDLSTVVKIVLILLILGISLGLTYLITVLACELSCSGQEGLALVVFILGMAGIIWLAIIATKRIFRKKEGP